MDGIYDGLKAGVVDAQENPLAVIELFRLYEVVRYVSMTNHMWSGFNLMANLGIWRSLPDAVRGMIERHVAACVRLQRQDQARLNGDLRVGLATRGLAFNEAAPAPFRARLSGVYANWKTRLGAKCWALLEAETGKLG